jgi:hypothetical protein
MKDWELNSGFASKCASSRHFLNMSNMFALYSFFSHFLQATKALTESRGIALLCFQTTALEEGEESAARFGRLLPPGNTRYPLNRRLGGTQGRSGQVRKISPPPGFNPRTFQSVTSRYTGWVTPLTLFTVPTLKQYIEIRMEPWFSTNVQNEGSVALKAWNL